MIEAASLVAVQFADWKPSSAQFHVQVGRQNVEREGEREREIKKSIENDLGLEPESDKG